VSDSDWATASDGLRARRSGPWAKDKLSFLDGYLPAALQATTTKRTRWYLDLFAGPGRNIIAKTQEEFAGSTPRALSAGNDLVHFTHAVAINKNAADHAALAERVSRLRASGQCFVPEPTTALIRGDSNREISRVMQAIHSRGYVFAFLDITKPTHLPWTTVSELKRQGHESVDLYILFPLGMAINRLLSWNSATVEQSAAALTSFYGTDDWRRLLELRITDAQSPELQRAVLDLYIDRLSKLGWAHVFVSRDVRRQGSIAMYKMIFATNHDVGARIGDWVRRAERSDGQQTLFD
jgi:three-Cys-motif partner protein